MKQLRKKKWERSNRARSFKTPTRVAKRRNRPELTQEQYIAHVEMTRRAAQYLTVPHTRQEREESKRIGPSMAMRLLPIAAAISAMGGKRR